MGDAAAAVHALKNPKQALFFGAEARQLQQRLDRPEARLALGKALQEGRLAHAMIDLSDGLLADLGHILSASNAEAELFLQDIPLSPPLQKLQGQVPWVWDWALAGGDDYELCFTAPAMATQAIQGLGARLDLPLSAIGRIVAADGPGDALLDARERIRVYDAQGQIFTPKRWGYNHFDDGNAPA